MAEREERKAALITTLAQARTSLDRAGHDLHHALDFQARAKRSFTENKWVWLGGAAIVGVVLARLSSRPRTVKVNVGGKHVKGEDVAKTGAALAVAKVVFDLARPILLRVVMDQVRPWVEQRFDGRPKA